MKIMCEADFNKAFHVRLADKCCANCKHGENEYEGGATCSHPSRNDGGNAYENGECASKWYGYNTMQCNVCNGWEAKEGDAE